MYLEVGDDGGVALVVELEESEVGLLSESSLKDLSDIVSGLGNLGGGVLNLVELLDDLGDEVVILIFIEIGGDLVSEGLVFLRVKE